jgi:hypothetical protein
LDLGTCLRTPPCNLGAGGSLTSCPLLVGAAAAPLVGGARPSSPPHRHGKRRDRAPGARPRTSCHDVNGRGRGMLPHVGLYGLVLGFSGVAPHHHVNGNAYSTPTAVRARVLFHSLGWAAVTEGTNGAAPATELLTGAAVTFFLNWRAKGPIRRSSRRSTCPSWASSGSSTPYNRKCTGRRQSAWSRLPCARMPDT